MSRDIFATCLNTLQGQKINVLFESLRILRVKLQPLFCTMESNRK